MEAILIRQKEIRSAIIQIRDNFKKDSVIRKTEDYLQARVESLNSLWGEFDINHLKLANVPDKSHEYFTRDIYGNTKALYEEVSALISSYRRKIDTPKQVPQTEPDQARQKVHADPNTMELMKQQQTNFRAFKRLIDNLVIDDIEEKWEVDDELRNLQLRWNQIDTLHLQIDNILQGSDTTYENEFTANERIYKTAKRNLNKRLGAMVHQHQMTPQADIPKFSGEYAQWPTFLDLFKGAIHDNPVLTKAQKMQQLKGKLRGEAERLIQHLNVSSDNYDTAWEILTHRYNNVQILFTKQIETFLNQPLLQKQTSADLKKLHDTTNECIYAIRNLGIDTTSWDPLLVHLLTKKLDSVTYSDYMEARESPRELPTFDEFMLFLEAKFTALEPINRKDRNELTPATRQLQPKYRENPEKSSKPSFFNYKKPYSSNAVLFKCKLCNSNTHALYQCRKFEALTPDMKLKTITKHGICVNCLHYHEKNVCNSSKRCRECNEEHNTLLHDAIRSEQLTSNTANKKLPLRQQNATHITSDDDEILLTTVQVCVRAADGTYVTLRALLDQGSQVTLITENAAQRLRLPRQYSNALISGVASTSKKGKGKVVLQCKSIHDEYSFTTQALVMAKVINNLPGHSISKKNCQHLQHLQLADPDYNISKPVDMLLDANVYSEILMSGLLKGSSSEPIAQQTRLGWILSGRVTLNCNVVIQNLDDIQTYWEMEDILDDKNDMTTQEQFCEDLYCQTTNRLPDGRYEVRLPMKAQFQEQLGTSKAQAVAQFKQLEKKLSNDNTLHDRYHQFIDEYVKLGHMKECVISMDPQCFLPHHGVHKTDSNAIRVVFNASSKTSSGHSLNDLMECGPKLQQDIQHLLLRWRTHRYVLTADCEKMYRMVLIHEQDQQLQKIIWRDTPQEALKEYQLCTITYGMKAAPFLAMRTLQQLAKDDAEKYPLAAKVLHRDFYVDDLLTGTDTIEQAQEVKQQLIHMLQGGGFNLRKWSSNSRLLLEDLTEEQLNPSILDFKNADSMKALGLRWNATTDTFTFQCKIDQTDMTKPHSKRSLLSDISKVFDPLGWLAPIAIKSKLLFQLVWTTGIDWDDAVSTEIQQEWSLLRKDLTNIDKFDIPRWIGDTQKPSEIHGFCDASEKVFACSVYLKSQDEQGKTCIRLIAAKTKLAPLNKTVSLPRLELCSATLLTKLMTKIRQSLQPALIDIPTYGWTDSMVVLGWLQGDPARWKTFVATRVKRIIDIMPKSCWRHVSSNDNAADCATRGLTPSQLANHPLWWEGPSWLKNDINDSTITADCPQIELKTKFQSNALQLVVPMVEEMLSKHSSLTRIVRIMSWVSRFISNARDKANAARAPHLTSSEIVASYNTIIKSVQARFYENDIARLIQKGTLSTKSDLLRLNPFLDENDILRVGGRLQNTKLTDTSKHPIIIPHDSRLTELVINQAHKATLHGGPRLTLAVLRNHWWIIGGNRAVKKHIRTCVTCRRFDNTKQYQQMADLPEPRVTPSRPFTHTGVDFTGQVELKLNKGRGVRTTKGYIAVFVCFATKAIHLELVSDLSSAAFMAAFKRMCARRGTPKHMYSDNGTNFIGAAKTLTQEYKQALKLYVDNAFLNDIAELGIKWHFNAPSWPSGGGLWEAAVASMKKHLKKVIGHQILTFEEFSTLLTQIEACLNSRPLYALTENIDDHPLTPGHFLTGGPILSSPFSDIGIQCLKTRWQLTEQMHKDFWRKWSTEYLHQLQTRSKWHHANKNLATDDIVLIKEDNMPPAKWALGKVTDLHPGQDGRVRVVTLKTQGGFMKRPIIKLVPLPVAHKPETDDKNPPRDDTAAPPITRTRRSRQRKPSLLATVLLLLVSIFTPTMQQMFSVSPLNNSNTLYFDKIADLGVIQDHWKMIVYYNMSSYWQSMIDINNYIQNLTELSKCEPTFLTIATQFDHELNELRHYNTLLTKPTPARKKRGWINGIGYAANTLFGVLDDRFAQKYEQDIAAIGRRENHLLNLFKNQTSIIEAENNILKRNEAVMNKQFTVINQHLQNLALEVNRTTKLTENAMKTFYVMTSAISVDVIISNLRRIQETLIDTVTNIYHGRIDLHLLSPKQIQEQLNIISGQLQGDLMIPVNNIKDLYSLLHIQARVTNKYLIMEIRIPLLNHDHFELDGVISIPQKRGDKAIYTTTQTKYIAINVRKDTIIPMTEYDIQSCIKRNDKKLLCPLHSPVYSLQTHDSICDMRLIINNDDKKYCQTEITNCTDKWVRLHARDSWLFSCCEECSIRILCPDGISTKRLQGTGVIALGQGCVLKGDTFTIHAHYDFVNQMFMQQKVNTPTAMIPSSVNDIINTSLPRDSLNIENHAQMYQEIQQKLDILKSQSLEELEPYEIPHHIINYSITSIISVLLLLCALNKLRQRCRRRSTTSRRVDDPIEMTYRRPVISECCVVNEVVPNVPNVASTVKCCEINKSVTSLNKSTCSFMDNTVSFDE